MKYVLALILLIPTLAFANGASHTCIGNADCSTQNVTNNTSTTNNQGGSGTGVGVASSTSNATGGSVTSSNDLTNIGVNSSVVTNKVGQEQGQGQLQGQKQSTDNANNSKQQTNVTVEGDKYEAADIPPSSAVAPTMFATAMCQAARSGAFQNSIFGISLGGTITDENCMKLEQFRVITNSIQDEGIKHGMACLASPLYKEASEWVGKECPAGKGKGGSDSKAFGQP